MWHFSAFICNFLMTFFKNHFTVLINHKIMKIFCSLKLIIEQSQGMFDPFFRCWGSDMLVSVPTSSGESCSWSWLLGWAPCWRRNDAFSIRPRSTARKRGVWPAGVWHSTESGPETETAGSVCITRHISLWLWGCRESADSRHRPFRVSSRMVWLLWTAASWRGVQPLLSVWENLSLCWTHRSFSSASLPAGVGANYVTINIHISHSMSALKYIYKFVLCSLRYAPPTHPPCVIAVKILLLSADSGLELWATRT